MSGQAKACARSMACPLPRCCPPAPWWLFGVATASKPTRVPWQAHRPPVGDGMIRSVKLWPARHAGPRSLRCSGTRRARYGQEEIKRVGSQTASVLLACELSFGSTCLSTSVGGRQGRDGGSAGKSAQAARLPAASRSYSGAGRKFRRGEFRQPSRISRSCWENPVARSGIQVLGGSAERMRHYRRF
jgi:hypothetical protein